MPLQGFRCPPGSPTFGATNSIEHCLGTCPHKCASPGLLAAIYKTDTENHHVGSYISASMLAGGGCPRQTVLERTKPLYEYPVRRFWSFRGTHAHSIVDRAVGLIDKFGWLSEMRMLVPLTYPGLPTPVFENGTVVRFDYDTPLVVQIGGTCDSYNPVTKELWDMKSMADAKAEMMVTGSKPGTYSPHLEDSWVKQLNIYRWLISKTPVTPGIRRKFKLKGTTLPAPTFLGIQGISMMNIPRTGATYAMHRSKRGQELYEVDHVPVWSLEDTEKFITEEAIKWYRWLVLGKLPGVVPKDKDWLCKSCAFNGERFADGICFPTSERKTEVLEKTQFILEE